MSVVSGKLVDPTGSPIVGAVVKATLRGSASWFDDHSATVVRTASTVTDAAGEWSLDLTPTDALADPSAYYVVQEDGREYIATVPATGGPYALSELLVEGPAPVGVVLGLSRAQADELYAPFGSTGGGTGGGISLADVEAAGYLQAADLDPWATDVELASGLAGKANTVHTHAQSDVTGLAAALAGKDAAGTAAGLLATHVAASDPHPGYATDADLSTGLAGKAATVHTHAIADTTGLQAALDGKAATVHTHNQADVTGLTTALAGKEATGVAAAAVATHEAASDPHPQYTNATELATALTPYALEADVAGDLLALDGRLTPVEARTQVLVLAAADPIPGGTPSGTVIFRTA